MKNIKIKKIQRELKNLLVKASFNLPEDILDAVKTAKKSETSKTAKTILDMIIKNSEIARCHKLPLCQDCGTVYINFEIGPDICIDKEEGFSEDFTDKVKITGKNHFILKAINETVSEVYKNNYLRASQVSDPLFERKNTKDNLPVIINLSFSGNSGLCIEVNLKGGGSENCSWLIMLNPSADESIIIDKVIQLVKSDVTKACPPVIIGLGIGSTASEVTKLARKAAFRNLKIRNADKRYAMLENKVLKAVNSTGIGPQGIGGKTTALACNIEFAPCHMATLPFSVFFGCHSTRRADIILNQ